MKGKQKNRKKSSIQPKSKKIKKQAKETDEEIMNYICGACSKGYKSYAALYFHIKRRYNGIKPPGTIVRRPVRPKIDVDVLPGRPYRTTKDIDNLDEAEVYLESIHNGFMHFLGDKLQVTSKLARKIPLEAIGKRIEKSCKDKTDKWSKDIQEESKQLVKERKEKEVKMQHLDFEDEFTHLDSNKSLRVIVWFMIWLAQILVKEDFIDDLCVIFSNVWRVLDEIELSAQDLDNKLVWKKVMKNCEGFISDLGEFKNDISLLNEFIQKSCHLVGKSFESAS